MSMLAKPLRNSDVIVAGGLLLITCAYVVSLPRNLGMTDESNFLYEAKRLADGEVMYRDVFDIISPVSLYITAAVFTVFGTDMGVARALSGLVHGIIAAAIYVGCRLREVRMLLAALAALSHLALLQPAWPFVSQHWFATAVMMLVLLSLLATTWPDRGRWPLLPGALTGVLIGIQHQRGVPLAVGLCGLFVAVHVCRRFYRLSPTVRDLASRLVYFAVGVVATAIPPFAVVIVLAGIDAVTRALVTFPLVNYRRNYRSPWGGVQFMTSFYAEFTYPRLLAWAPVSVVTAPLRIIGALRQRRDLHATQQLITLLVFALVASASIAYYPDFVHLAFIAPVFLLALADGIEAAMRLLPTGRAATVGTALLMVVAAGFLISHMQRNAALAWSTFPVPYDTRFGRLDLANQASIPALDKARELLDASPVKELFCYPAISGPYLITGAKNPTPYQFLAPNYGDPGQVEEIIGILERRRTPFILTVPLAAKKHDPIVEYITAHYDYVDVGVLPNLFLYARKPQ